MSWNERLLRRIHHYTQFNNCHFQSVSLQMTGSFQNPATVEPCPEYASVDLTGGEQFYTPAQPLSEQAMAAPQSFATGGASLVDINGNILSSSQLSSNDLLQDKDNSSSTVFTSNNSLASSWHNSSALGESQGHSSSSYGDHFMHFTLPISPVKLFHKSGTAALVQEQALYHPGATGFVVGKETDSDEIFGHSTANEIAPVESSSMLSSVPPLPDDQIQESDEDVPLSFSWEDAVEQEGGGEEPPIEVGLVVCCDQPSPVLPT